MTSGRSRRRAQDAHDQEHENDERWLVSYADMITVLMCLFIVLFSMSSIDKEKYQQLRNSLATGFGVVESVKIDTAEGVVAPPERVSDKGQGFTDLELAAMEVRDLSAIREKIRAALKKRGLAHTVEFVMNQRGLTIRLISSETFFHPDRADLTTEAGRVMSAIAPVLKFTKNDLSVEGHAAKGVPKTFPTTWELSAARATTVLRHLVEKGGVPPKRAAALAYGSARQINRDTTLAERRMNRRVDIVVISAQPETVRALIPNLITKPVVEEPAYRPRQFTSH